MKVLRTTGLSISFTLLAVVVLTAITGQANLLTNGSFENTNNTFVGDANKVMQVASGQTTIPGWTTTNGVPTAWLQNGNPYNISASDGDFFLDLTNYNNVGTYGGVMQSFTTTPGTMYTVMFDLGYGGNSTSFSGPVSVTATAAGFTGTFASASGDPRPALWDMESFNFTATSATTTLTIIGLSTAGGQHIGLDNVDVEVAQPTTTPEPSSVLLLGTGLLALVGTVRRIFHC